MSRSHPSIDRSDGHVVVTETRAEVLWLSEARADLLVRSTAAGRAVVVVSDEVTRLTYPLREALQDAGGAWVVRSLDGTLRDGLTGRRLTSVADAVSGAQITDPTDIAVRHLRPQTDPAVQLTVSMSVRHRAADTTLLGGTVEVLAEHMLGVPPTGWGLHEPCATAWDRTRLTELARARTPHETTLVVSGADALIGTVRVARTDTGLEETTSALIRAGVPGSAAAEAAAEAVAGVAATLSERHMPLFGLVLARTGRADLTLPAQLEGAPTPVGMLLGPPAVRELALDPAAWTERFGARVLGRPRVPGLWVPLGSMREPGWDRLTDVLTAIGPERVRAVLAPTGAPWQEVMRGTGH